MLYACDGHWWKARGGVPEFLGLKLSQDVVACTAFLDVHKVTVEHSGEIAVDDPGVVGTGGATGGNSGFQAINLAVQFGIRRIVLIGFDMRIDHGIHWHGPHGKGLNNPKTANVMKWRKGLDSVAGRLANLGVEVFNASPVSTLTAYPLVKLEDVLAGD